MAYTPGPWRTYRDKNKRVSQIMSNNGRICTIHPSDANGEDNARLIAAAPELLEAAEEFLAIELKTIWPRAYGKSTYNDAFYKLKNAIAKAKGEVSDG